MSIEMKRSGPTKANRSGISTPNDRVMTPLWLAKTLVDYFHPSGKCLEPARGTGNIYKLLPKPRYWCEISGGRDFFKYNRRVDWIITNPPFSIYDKFLLHSLELGDNVVFLTTLQKVFRGRLVDEKIQVYGGIKEIVRIGSGGVAGFPFGFPIGFLHYKKDFVGPTTFSHISPTPKFRRSLTTEEGLQEPPGRV